MADSLESPHQITQLLSAGSDDNRAALDELLPLVYAELHRQAVNFRRKERANHTLQTTAMIHEAHLRLIEQRGGNCELRIAELKEKGNLRPLKTARALESVVYSE